MQAQMLISGLLDSYFPSPVGLLKGYMNVGMVKVGWIDFQIIAH
jgi:hypothetical protein